MFWNSFSGRLTLYGGALMLLLSVLLSAMLNRAAENRMIEARSITLQNVAQNAAGRLFYNLRDRQREIALLAHSPLLTQGSWNTHQIATMLELSKQDVPFFAWLGVADNAGLVKIGTDGIGLGQAAGNTPWFIQGLQQNTVSPIYQDTELSTQLSAIDKFAPTRAETPASEPRRFIDFSAPIQASGTPDEAPIGVIVARSNWSWLRTVLQSALSTQATADGIELWLIDRNGQVIHPYGASPQQPLLWPASEETSLITWGTSGKYLSTSIEVPSITGMNMGWRVVARQSEAKALASVASFHHVLWIAGLFTALLAFLLAYRMTRKMSAPLERITQQAQSIANGQNLHFIPPQGGVREIQQLAQALSSMTATLLNQQQALIESNTELENKVTQRTTELDNAYQSLFTQAQGIADLYNYAPVGYHSLDSHGVFRFINDRELDWLGYERSEVVERMNIRDLLTPESQKIFDTQNQNATDNKPQPPYDLDMVRKNGEVFTVQVNNMSVLDNNGHFLFSRTALVDISHLRQLEKQLRNEQQLNHAIIQSTSNGLSLYNSAGQCLLANQAAADLVGSKLEDLLQRNFHHIQNWKTTGLYNAALAALHGKTSDIWIDTTSSYGKKVDSMVTVTPLQHNGETMVLLVLKDVSALASINRELAKAARVDVLTGVSNRLAGNEKLMLEFARMQRTHKPFCVLMLDIDHFKTVNDTWGHACGDQVLIAVAQAISASIRVTDVVARYGGEEFVVILPDIDPTEALAVAEKIRQRIEQTAMPHGLHITASLGVATIQLEDSRFDLALNRADSALYEAKRTGRNRVVLDKLISLETKK